MKQKIFITLGAVMGLAGQLAHAAPFGSFDARSAGMGNAGVAAGTIANAAFFNPAMLAAQKPGDRVSLLLPVVGVRVSDPSGLVDDIEAFQSAYDAADMPAANAALTAANGKAVLADVNAGMVVSFSGKRMGGALSVNSYTRNSVSVSQGADSVTFSDSYVNFVGIQSSEIGYSFAAGAGNDSQRFAWGVTPKYVRLKTNDYRELIKNDPTLTDNADNQTGDSGFNLDAGLVYGATRGWRAGVVGRNLVSTDHRTVNNRVIILDPQYRAGVAYGGGWFTFAADMDLTENNPVYFDQKTRMLAVGTELNVFKTLQLRLGWQRNLADTGDVDALDLRSVGLGLSVYGMHVDVAAVGNDNDVGAVAALGFRF
jgi:hypothetical protein